MSRFARLLVIEFLLLGAAHAPAVALATAPELRDEELRDTFALGIPGYWNVEAFEVTAIARGGIEPAPVVETRFQAQVSLAVDTYLLERKEGAITWVVPVAGPGVRRSIHGTSRSVWRDGGWSTELTLENDPSARMGQPLDYFSGHVIVAGTPEAAEYHAKLAAAQARTEAQQRQAELDTLKHLRRVEDLKRAQALAERQHALRMEVQALERERTRDERRALERAALAGRLAVLARAALEARLPVFWQVTELELHGTGPPPDRQHRDAMSRRFIAAVVLARDTVEKSREIGGAQFVRAIAPAGTRRELYGSARFAHAGEAWSVAGIELQNDPLTALGEPSSFLTGLVYVEGSEEARAVEDKLLAETRAQAQREEAQAAERHAREIAALERRRKMEEKQQALELARVRSTELLQEEREQIEARREARDAARARSKIAAIEQLLASGDSAALHQALRDAFDDRQGSVGDFALRRALELPDAGLRDAAYAYALRHEDAELANKYVIDALRDGSRDNKIAAFLQFARSSGTLVLKATRNGKKFQPLTLLLNTVSPDGRELTGHIAESRCEPSARGSVTGLGLSLAGERCSIALELQGGRTLVGTFRNAGYTWQVSRVLE